MREDSGAPQRPQYPSRFKVSPYLVVHMRRAFAETEDTVTASSTSTASAAASTWSGVLAYANEFRYPPSSGNNSADIGGDFGTQFSVVTGTGSIEPFNSFYRTVSTDFRSYVPAAGTHYFERTPDSYLPPIFTFEMICQVHLPLQGSNGLTGGFFALSGADGNHSHGFGYIQTDEAPPSEKYVAWVSARTGALSAPLETSYTYADASTFSYPETGWAHIAVERCGAKWSYFVEGQRVLTMTQSASASYTAHGALSLLYAYLTNPDTTASNSLMIGIHPRGAWKGYIDSFRVTCDETVYGDVSSFTPPTRLLDKCRYLLHFDNTLSAATTTNYTMYGRGWYGSVADYYYISASDTAAISNIQAKFGGSSLRCTGGYFVTPNRYGTMIGKSRFSVDFWIYPESTLSANSYIFDSRGLQDATSTARDSLAIHGLANGGLALKWGDNAAFASTTSAIAINTWTHVAVDRNSLNAVTLYINGNVIASSTVTASIAYGQSNKLVLGGTNLVSGGVGRYMGFIDEFRFMLHTAAWAGAAFTPPTSAYANRYLPR